jgi:hypothetical protein
MVGGWRRLHNEELHKLCTASHIIRTIKPRIRWEGHVVQMGEMRSVYNILAGNHEGKRLLGILGGRWENNIRMDLRKIRWEGVYWIHLAQYRG